MARFFKRKTFKHKVKSYGPGVLAGLGIAGLGIGVLTKLLTQKKRTKTRKQTTLP